jgi:hypothetical protein
LTAQLTALLRHCQPPPDFAPPQPIVWLLLLPPPLRIALFFAYWLYVAATGVMVGMGVLGSLAGSAILVIMVLASYLAMTAALRREWLDEAHEMVWRIVAMVCRIVLMVIGGIAILVPAFVVLALALWGLASLPLWLYRR